MTISSELWSLSKTRKRRVGACAATWHLLLTLFLSLPLTCSNLACSNHEEPARLETQPIIPSPTPAPPRIVSLSAVASRFVTALGVAHLLVGVDEESSLLSDLAHLPVVELDSVRNLSPDIVLISSLANASEAAVHDLESAGAQLMEFAPHDFEDVFVLCRGFAAKIVGVASATLFERQIARHLAMVGGISPPRGRLRVVAVVGLEPPELAGGHSFETDLIEIAGGTSITHGGANVRIAMTPERWDEFSPDLVLVTTPGELGLPAKKLSRSMIPERFAVAFFSFDPETFWLNQPARDAERLRTLIASYSHKRVPPPEDPVRRLRD